MASPRFQTGTRSVIRPTTQAPLLQVRMSAIVKKIIEFEESSNWTTPNTLYRRGQKLYLGGNGKPPKYVTVKQAIRWFLDCRRCAQVFTHEGGIDFLLTYALQK